MPIYTPNRLKTGRIKAGTKGFISWSAKNREKSAMLVFSVVFVIGTAIFGIMALVDKMGPKSAINTNGEEYAIEIPGWWYQEYFGSSICNDDNICGTDEDTDHDGLTNQQEFFYNTNPVRAYTVNDTLNDGELVVQGFDPSREGRVLFTEVLTDTKILEEGLLFESEIQEIIKKGNDISQVQIPLLDDDKINIIYEDNQEVYEDYLNGMGDLIKEYFPESEAEDLKQRLEGASNNDLKSEVYDAKSLAAEMQSLEVPAKMASFHKYNIAFWQLFSEVIITPAPDLNISMTDSTMNEWYDKAQAFLAVQQRLDLEKSLLERQFNQQ